MQKKTKRNVIVSALGGAGLSAGVAVAAVLLATSITGHASVTQGGAGSGTSNEVKVALVTSSTNGSQLNCDDIGVSPNFGTLTFNPKLTVPANGGNADSQPIAGGSCTVKVTVKNTGSKAIHIDPQSSVSLPTGWVPTDFTGLPSGALAPGQSDTIQVTITAQQNAQSGDITGKLVYSD